MPSAREIRAGGAYVELYTENNKLIRGLRAAEGRIRAFGQTVAGIGKRLMLFSAGIVALFGASAKTFASMGDAVHKMAARTGMSTEALSELGFAAEQSGADMETLEAGIKGMQTVLRNAERGLSRAVANLGALGLAYEDFAGLSPEDQLKLVADRLAGIEDPSKRAALAMQVLGGAGQKLLPLLSGGRAGMEELQQEARRLGLTIDQQTADAAAEFTDQMNVLGRTVKAGVFAIGGALVPVLIKLARSLTDNVAQITAWIRNHQEAIVTAATWAVRIAGAGAALYAFGKAIGVVSFALKAFTTALAFVVAHPVAATLLTTAAAVAVLVNEVRKATTYTAQLSDEMGRLYEEGEKQRNAQQAHIDRLNQLASKERLNTSEMQEARSRLSELKEEYGDFGEVLNEVTAKLDGWTEALQRIERIRTGKARAEARERLIEINENLVGLAKQAAQGGTKPSGGLGLGNEGLSFGLGLGGREPGASLPGEEGIPRWLRFGQWNDEARDQRNALLSERRKLMAEYKGYAAGELWKPKTGGASFDALKADSEAFADFEKGASAEIQRLRIDGIEDEHQRAIANIEAKYGRERQRAEELFEDQKTRSAALARVEEARQEALANAANERFRALEAEGKRQREERAVFEEGIQAEIARAEIEASGAPADEKRKRLLELDRQEELARAKALGADVDDVKKLWDLKAKILGGAEIARHSEARGTFSAAAAKYLALGGETVEKDQLAALKDIAATNQELVDAAEGGGLLWGA